MATAHSSFIALMTDIWKRRQTGELPPCQRKRSHKSQASNILISHLSSEEKRKLKLVKLLTRRISIVSAPFPPICFFLLPPLRHISLAGSWRFVQPKRNNKALLATGVAQYTLQSYEQAGLLTRTKQIRLLRLHHLVLITKAWRLHSTLCRQHWQNLPRHRETPVSPYCQLSRASVPHRVFLHLKGPISML